MAVNCRSPPNILHFPVRPAAPANLHAACGGIEKHCHLIIAAFVRFACPRSKMSLAIVCYRALGAVHLSLRQDIVALAHRGSHCRLNTWLSPERFTADDLVEWIFADPLPDR